MTGTAVLDRLQSWLASATDDPAFRAIAGRPVALGWATVELERAALDLGAALDVPPERFVDARPSTALGARCRVARDVLPSGVALVLVEPFTEGRLAATLARRDEGPAAVWLAVTSLAGAVKALRAAGVATTIARPGPLGAELLVPDGPIHGPHRLVVELAGTIRA